MLSRVEFNAIYVFYEWITISDYWLNYESKAGYKGYFGQDIDFGDNIIQLL